MRRAKSTDVFKRRKTNKINLLRDRFELHVHHFFAVASPHGLVHLVRPKRTRFEKVFWIVCLILVAIPCGIVTRQAWARYWHAPTVNALMRDYPKWTHNFPGFTLCPVHVDQDDMEHIYLQYYNNTNTTWNEFDAFLQALLFGNFSTYGNLISMKDKFGDIDPNQYLELHRIAASNWYNVMEDDEVKHRFVMDETITEAGVCFSFNSKVANYSSFERFTTGNMEMLSNYDLSVVEPGEESPGITITNIRKKLKVYIHPSNEIPSVLDKYDLLEGFVSLVYITLLEMRISEEHMSELSIGQRHCRYLNESNLKYFPIYTTNLCLLECRMWFALEYCKCFPYYYRNLYGEKICNIDGMICLSQYNYELTKLKNRTTDVNLCSCVQNCESDLITKVSVTPSPWVFAAQLQISVLLITQTRMTLKQIYSGTDFVVQIGGLLGLAYGVGILSGIEILYFLTMRLYFAVCRGRTVRT